MGMIIVDDKVHKRLLRYKKNPLLRKLNPKGKITHSMIIESGLDALDSANRQIAKAGSVL